MIFSKRYELALHNETIYHSLVTTSGYYKEKKHIENELNLGSTILFLFLLELICWLEISFI